MGPDFRLKALVRSAWTCAAAAPLLWAGCAERTPTSLDGDLLPEAPVTVEVFIPWAQFGAQLEVFGGFGSARDLGLGFVAHQFADTLESRTFARHGAYPTQTSVRDSAGTVVNDTSLTFIGARVVARIDTLASEHPGSVLLSLGAPPVAWDPVTATWTHAVDSIGVTTPWPEPGGGPVSPLDTATWVATEGDSVAFELDSATVAALADTTNRARGFRLEALTAGTRLQVRAIDLQLLTRPSVHPDTLVYLGVRGGTMTFVYDPIPAPPPDGIRVGGTPAWRTFFAVSVPDSLTGPPELCAAVGCPAPLEADQVNYASLLLTSRESPGAFQPIDSVLIDMRPVLAREVCPKCPLGEFSPSLTRRLPASVFTSPVGSLVELPITPFIRNIVRGETATGGEPSTSLALLSPFEPLSIAFASFEGPGSPQEPVLRLIVTVGGSVALR